MTTEKLFPTTLMPDDDWWHALWPDPRQVLDDIGITPGMSVVDLCCGNGHFTAPLCSLAAPGQVTGLDIDEQLLTAAIHACKPFDNFTPLLADARDINTLLDNPVDHVLIANTFHGVPDKKALSRAVYAALHSDGAFTVINWYPQPREETPVLGQPRGPDVTLRMSPAAVAAEVEPAGFRLDYIADVGPYHYGAVFTKNPGSQNQ